MKQAARWLLGRVQSSLLVALLIYKLLTVFAFVPLMQQVWATALRFSPTQYITTDNLTGLLRSPTLLAAILIIVICTAWWALYEFSLILCGLDYARHDQRCSLLPLLRRAAMSIKHAFLPKNWGALLYAAVLIPFTNLFLTSNYISQLAVPEYIAEVINANTAMHIAYSIVFVLLCALSVCWILTLQYFILSGKDFRSGRCRNHGIRDVYTGTAVLWRGRDRHPRCRKYHPECRPSCKGRNVRDGQGDHPDHGRKRR